MQHQLCFKNSLGNICRFSNFNQDKEITNLLKCHKPFIIKNFSSDWPAFINWNLDYMAQKEEGSKVWVRDATSHAQNINNMLFSEFINSLKDNIRDNFIKKNLYLVISRIMSHSNARDVQLHNLLQDIILPKFIPIERLWEVNLWIGAGGNRSRLHFDPEENLLVPIRGKKNIILIHRSYTKDIYQEKTKGSNIIQSEVDIFNIDREKFPKIDNVSFYQTTIEPGEALYIPSGWWHAVESSREINIAVNIWWLPNISFLWKFPTCTRLWEKKEKWQSVLMS